MFLETAALCLALNIYHEARGEHVMGQYAVANVTMNRAKHRNDLVCKEVVAPHQFSWTTNGVVIENGKRRLLPHLIPQERHQWDVAKKVANAVLNKKVDIDFTKGATYYHANYVSPYWSYRFKRTTKIGNHIFYRRS